MKKIIGIVMLCHSLVTTTFAQEDTLLNVNSSIFERITKSMNDYQLDTTTVPNDKMTKLIIELRNLRGGFNINEAIEFKLAEDKHKMDITDAEFEKISMFFKNGDGNKWLNNAMIWIYRQHFSYKELKHLVGFYKTSAGQKMASDFPFIMLKSFAAAEAIKNIYLNEQNPEK
jgi:hypothetical protein